MATLALAGLGAAVGSFAGGITILEGFQLGAAIGGYIDAQNAIPDTELGKLSDLKVGSSAYGTRLPWVWGRIAVPGIFSWAAVDANGNHLKETRTTKRVGGKGGGAKQTNYTYSATFAIEVCQASIFFPDSSRSDGGTFGHRSPALKRVKADDIVIYDSSAVTNIITPTWHNGTETQAVDATISSLEANSPGYRGVGYFVLTDLQLADFGNRIPNFTVEIETSPVTVGDILSDLFQAIGLLPSQFDVSAASATVAGFCIPSRGALRDSINTLALAYAIDFAEIDGKIVAVPRGGSSVVTIPAGDLGATSGGTVQTLPRTRSMTAELPGRVDVAYLDSDTHYQAGLQTEVRQSGDTTNVETYSFPLSLTGTAGRNIAGRILDTRYVEAERFSFQLPPKYLYLAPTDVVTLPTNTGNVRARITKAALAPLGEIKFEAVADGVNVLTQTLPGGATPPQPPASYTVIPTTFVAWSGREVLDAHQESEGFYVAAAGPSGWSGCTIYYSTDNEASWITGPDVTRASAFGTATITNYAGSAGSIAGSATVVVPLDAQAFLESCSSSELDQGVNWAYIGGEYVAIRDYNLTATRTYSATTIKRGLRSTPMNSHGSNELFVEMTDNVARITVSPSMIGTTIKVRCVSRFQTIADVTSVDVVIQARTPLPIDNLTNMSFVVLGASSATPNERVLTQGAGLSIVDSGAGNAITVSVATNGITNAMLSTVATGTFKGRTTAGTGNVEDLTGTQATALLDVFASGTKGLVPASGGGTTNFLRADGTFATPPVASPAGSTGQIQYNVSGAFAASSGFTYTAAGLGLDGPLVQTLAANGLTADLRSVTALGVTALKQRPSGNTRINIFSATGVFWTAASGSVSGADTGGYTDATTAYNSGTFNVFNGGAALKRVYIGYYDGLPNGIGYYYGVGGTTGASGVVVWERWNGSSWTTFTGSNLTGGIEGWMNPQGTSARSTINGVSAYWIRGTVQTAYTTAPIYRFSMMQSGYYNAADNSYSAGLFIGKSNLPSGVLSNMTNMGVLSMVVPGNGEQNIITAYSEYTGSLLFSVGGDGSIASPNSDNQFRSLRLSSGPMNPNGSLTFNSMSGLSSYNNYFIGANYPSGKNFDFFHVQRNGTTTARWKENNEVTVTGNLRVTSPANRSLTTGTTTVNASTTVTGVSTQFLRELSVDDEIAVSSASTTWVRVTAIASDTSLTVASAIGNGTTQTITVRKPIQRYYDQSGVLRWKQEYNGTVKASAGYSSVPVAATFGATVTLDCSLGNQFSFTATSNFTLANMTNAQDGQLILVKIKQDATGSRLPTFDTKYRFGTDLPSPTLTTTANKTDYLGFRYDATDDKFDFISFVRGF